MANYGVTNSTYFGVAQPAVGSSYTALIAVAASTEAANMNSAAGGPTYAGFRRGRIYDILVGTNGTPADNAMEWICQRVTAGSTPAWVGSISTVSSQFALDVADNGFSAFATINTTTTSSLAFSLVQNPPWYVGVNQRASYRWVAAPGSEIVWPANTSATGNNGLVLSVKSAGYTGTATGAIMFNEG
jgi:hypothetical protein